MHPQRQRSATELDDRRPAARQEDAAAASAESAFWKWHRTPRQNDSPVRPRPAPKRHGASGTAITPDDLQINVNLAHVSLPDLSWRTGAKRTRARVTGFPRDSCCPSDLVRIRLPHEYGHARRIEVHPGDDRHGCIDAERAADMDRNGATAMKHDVPAVPSSKTHRDLHLSIWAQGNRTLVGMT